MSIRKVCETITLLEGKGDMALHRVCKNVTLLGRGDIDIGRVNKDVMLLTEKWRISYNKLHKCVTLAGEMGTYL
jgi:hypothetical protein